MRFTKTGVFALLSFEKETKFFAPPSSFSLCERKRLFSPAARAGMFYAPHFFFLVRKKKRYLRAKSLAALGCAPKRACGRRCTVQRKRGLAAALRRLGLLRIDRLLITKRRTIWKFFRMRFYICATAAQWVQSILFCQRSGSGKRKYTHAKGVPKRKLKAIRYFH